MKVIGWILCIWNAISFVGQSIKWYDGIVSGKSEEYLLVHSLMGSFNLTASLVLFLLLKTKVFNP